MPHARVPRDSVRYIRPICDILRRRKLIFLDVVCDFVTTWAILVMGKSERCTKVFAADSLAAFGSGVETAVPGPRFLEG